MDKLEIYNANGTTRKRSGAAEAVLESFLALKILKFLTKFQDSKNGNK